MHGTDLLQMSWSTKQDMRSKHAMWLLQPSVFSWRKNNCSSYFASWGKIDTAQKMYVGHHNTLWDSLVWFQPKQDSDRISFFKTRIGLDSKNPLSDHLCCAHAAPASLQQSIGRVAACQSSTANLELRDEQTEKFFSPSPVLIKLNLIQSWSAKFLKIISPIQSWSTNVKSCIHILPHEAKQQLELFCL